MCKMGCFCLGVGWSCLSELIVVEEVGVVGGSAGVREDMEIEDSLGDCM